jgi:transcriptional regulator with XRE-family HTH domain
MTFIRLWRLVNDVTLRQLARDIASNKSLLSRVERFPERLGPRLAAKLAAHLDVPRSLLKKNLSGEAMLRAIVTAAKAVR